MDDNRNRSPQPMPAQPSPGAKAYLLVFRLLAEAILDLLLLPFRLIAFLLVRKRVTRDIDALLKDNSRPDQK